MGLGPCSSADITEPANRADYQLGFLPPDDAFYAVAGYLGERRLLPMLGRGTDAETAIHHQTIELGLTMQRLGL